MQQKHFAYALLAIALTHAAVGLFLFANPLIQLVSLGWIGQINEDQLAIAASVWFMLFTLPLLMLVAQCWQKPTPVSPAVLWIGVVMAILGVSLMPDSGFWLVLVLCLWGLKPVAKSPSLS